MYIHRGCVSQIFGARGDLSGGCSNKALVQEYLADLTPLSRLCCRADLRLAVIFPFTICWSELTWSELTNFHHTRLLFSVVLRKALSGRTQHWLITRIIKRVCSKFTYHSTAFVSDERPWHGEICNVAVIPSQAINCSLQLALISACTWFAWNSLRYLGNDHITCQYFRGTTTTGSRIRHSITSELSSLTILLTSLPQTSLPPLTSSKRLRILTTAVGDDKNKKKEKYVSNFCGIEDTCQQTNIVICFTH